MNGLLFDIQRFSVHDGPGIRTTFFLKGCPLHCKWCHNPEGLEQKVQLQYLEESCIGCGDCEKICKNSVHHLSETAHIVDFAKCTACQECVNACPSGALRMFGMELTPQEVVKTALREKAFYGKTGGVTFSGGEASMQGEFLLEALTLCKQAELHTTVDTCGLMPKERLEKLTEVTDLFLYDIKALTPEIHKAGTGVDNAQILANYKFLMPKGCRVWVRVPVIGGFNSSEAEIEKIAVFLQQNSGVEQIELMPYHKLGAAKYAQIGRIKPLDKDMPVTHEQMQTFYDILRRHDLPVTGAK